MSAKLEKLKDRAKALEVKDPKGSVEAWLEALKVQEEEADPNPDLAIFNRIGDLYLKLKDPATAADYYDKAVDRYAELGFHNNAIAMCNKVLRNAPGRQTTYLKLAKLYAAKGFMPEAKQNFVEYAERMQKAGKIEHAFAALKQFTDITPEAEDLRRMLEEHLKMYGADVSRRSQRLSTPADAVPDLKTGPKRKTSSLVFLDLDEPSPSKRAAKPAAPTAAAAPPAPAPPVQKPEPGAVSLLETPSPEPDTSLEIETTSLAEEAPATDATASGMLDGLELTSTDFGDVRKSAAHPPSLRDEVTAGADIEPMAGLEPTAPEDTAEPLLDAELEIEGAPAAPPPPRRSAPKVQPPKAKPPAPPPAPPPTPKRKTVVEVPPLELEPDFEAATTEASHEVDDQPLTVDEAAADWVETEEGAARGSGFIDLGVEGIVNSGDQAGSLVFTNIEQGPAALSIEELEARVADNPDDAEAHRALGEALIEAGERDRGIEELDLATVGFEGAGNLAQALDLVEEILRLDPNSVRHRQKRVEFAFKAGDKGKLIDAYLELADALLRTDLPEKARAVYERVAEHDPNNVRAKSALSMLTPPPPTPKEGKVAAKDAKMTVRDEAGEAGDFVDLGALILEEEPAERDTRMKVEDEQPTGDEEQDFQEMLARFKQGIDENIDEADFQSHYDLGVAFKEMGLLDEAISEFQKALRAPDGKLRTSEALGVCFFEKGAYGVAESILRRGLELPAAGDQERLGILYWLGRALEEQGKGAEARELYGRVFAVDIRFMDVGERVKTLAKAR
ncbi:MAG: tetratricopeptide repeat protein [Gemmatimonadetes bacterium]|nr:tetratricopeptide repeat protein [Gemmatimonadota bacterium]